MQRGGKAFSLIINQIQRNENKRPTLSERLSDHTAPTYLRNTLPHEHTMQTRSQNSESGPKAQRYLALQERLRSKVDKANAEAKQQKRREQKLQAKEQLSHQKQLLRSRMDTKLGAAGGAKGFASSLNFFGEYVESDEQIKTRLHSHLLTGRLQNRALQAFAMEVLKKNWGQLSQLREDSDDFEVDELQLPKPTFKRAARKATQLLADNSRQRKGIIKRPALDLLSQQNGSDLSLCRQMRALKRSEQKAFFESGAKQDVSLRDSSREDSSEASLADMAFMTSDSHYLKKVCQHPERDVDTIRVIDQPCLKPVANTYGPQILARTSPLKQKKVVSFKTKVTTSSSPQPLKKSSLPSLDLATAQQSDLLPMTAAKQALKKGRHLVFNDTVEVYYYPENKEQHAHHQQDDSEDDEGEDEDFDDLGRDATYGVDRAEEEFLTNEDPELSKVSQNKSTCDEQEQTDPSFESLLLEYMRSQLVPKLKQASSPSSIASPSKRARRGRASSLNSINLSVQGLSTTTPEGNMINPDDQGSSDDFSESHGSTTYDATLATSASSSSGLNSANAGVHSPPSERKPLTQKQHASQQRLYEGQSLDLTILGVTQQAQVSRQGKKQRQQADFSTGPRANLAQAAASSPMQQVQQTVKRALF